MAIPTPNASPPHGRPPVRLPVFEGPLDLLLHLIRSHKLDIRDIPISQVAEQYLEYLALMESLDLDIAGEFLVLAATLMEIKSRMLLPLPELPIEDEETGDPRAELVARLLEYARFQQAAGQLRELASETNRTFSRPAPEQWEGAVPLIELRPGDLLEALRRLRLEGEKGEKGSRRSLSLRVRRQAINLRQRMAAVLRRVLAAPAPLPFSALITRSGCRLDRIEVLVIFLAILELVRLGQISAWQQGLHGEIFLCPRLAGTEEEQPDPAFLQG